jgi:serine/threonine-protein kinase RsbW
MEPPVRHTLYPPAHHRDRIARLLDHVGANAELAEAPPEDPSGTDRETVLLTGVNELEGCAEIFVREVGEDVVKEVRKVLRRFCLEHVSTINLFLSLENPHSARITEELERLGFFFAGILPESRIGDALILQYLNNVDLDYDGLTLVTDVARELLAYVRARDPNRIE